MPQDQSSGAAANEYGRATAKLIASAIGATMIGNRSNEAQYKGKRIVIKCARSATTSVGVTYEMQKNLHEILAAFETTKDKYEVFSLPVAIFSAKQRPTRSQGAAAHKVGLVSRKVFIESGVFVSSVSVAAGDA